MGENIFHLWNYIYIYIFSLWMTFCLYSYSDRWIIANVKESGRNINRLCVSDNMLEGHFSKFIERAQLLLHKPLFLKIWINDGPAGLLPLLKRYFCSVQYEMSIGKFNIVKYTEEEGEARLAYSSLTVGLIHSPTLQPNDPWSWNQHYLYQL